MSKRKIKAVIFDWGHTIMNELKYRGAPLHVRPVELMPNIPSALQAIPLKMGIWANTKKTKAKDIKHWLKRAKLDRYFTWVVTSKDAGFRKPDNKFFDYALEKCKLKKGEIIFVGNQLNTDIKGANDFGIISVYLSSKTHHSPDETMTLREVKPAYTIKNLASLPKLLKKLEII